MNGLLKGVVRAKSVALRGMFYWTGKLVWETIGREFVYAKNRILLEEDIRYEKSPPKRCPKCGHYYKDI